MRHGTFITMSILYCLMLVFCTVVNYKVHISCKMSVGLMQVFFIRSWFEWIIEFSVFLLSRDLHRTGHLHLIIHNNGCAHLFWNGVHCWAEPGLWKWSTGKQHKDSEISAFRSEKWGLCVFINNCTHFCRMCCGKQNSTGQGIKMGHCIFIHTLKFPRE